MGPSDLLPEAVRTQVASSVGHQVAGQPATALATHCACQRKPQLFVPLPWQG